MQKTKTQKIKRYRIILDRKECIGAGPCTTYSKNWVVDPMKDGKATFMGKGEGKDYLIVEVSGDEIDIKKELEAAKSCPVNVIHIEDAETGERLV